MARALTATGLSGRRLIARCPIVHSVQIVGDANEADARNARRGLDVRQERVRESVAGRQHNDAADSNSVEQSVDGGAIGDCRLQAGEYLVKPRRRQPEQVRLRGHAHQVAYRSGSHRRAHETSTTTPSSSPRHVVDAARASSASKRGSPVVPAISTPNVSTMGSPCSSTVEPTGARGRTPVHVTHRVAPAATHVRHARPDPGPSDRSRRHPCSARGRYRSAGRERSGEQPRAHRRPGGRR